MENKTKIIVEDIRGDKTKEYIVRKHEQLTLVLIVQSSIDAHINVHLSGQGARAMIIGCIIGRRDTAVVLHTLQHHEAPDTTSDLLVKSVLRDHATFSFDGAIRVERIAQKTDAYQRNENLLLSDTSHAQSRPILEILANDVRCTHGATISAVSHEHLWYLATRGINTNDGTSLIAQGFIDSAISKISDTILVGKLQKKIWQTS